SAGLAALEGLWSEAHGQYLCRDRVSGELVVSASVGGLLPVFAAVPRERAARIARTIERWGERVTYLVPSHDPDDPRYEPQRYWRGPVWLVVNYMIADGLARDRKSTRLNSSHVKSSYAVFCLKKKKGALHGPPRG